MNIFLGFLSGVVLGALNLFLLKITVRSAIGKTLKKVRLIIIFSYFVRYVVIAVLLLIIIKTQVLNVFAFAGGLAISTFLFPKFLSRIENLS
ncbi:MAG: ATP synthase subunit I [Candidatus Firestonebacteria bacterium]